MNATTDQSAVNVTFYWYDDGSGSLIYNFTIYNDTASDTVFENSSFNTALIPDGIFNITVNATNSTGAVVSNATITGVTIDNTAPTVSVVSPVTSTWYDENFTVSVNVTETNDISSVSYRVLNSTGSNVTGWKSLTLNSSLYNGTFDIISQDDAANYTFEFNATDNFGNSNSTVNLSGVHIDDTNPAINSLAVSSVSSSGGTLTVNSTDLTAGVSNCTYADAGSGSLTLSSGLYTATLSSLSASTSYTVNVTCTDLAGNIQSNTTTFTTSAASSSSSSSSSSGGGGSSSTQRSTYVTNTWYNIEEGATETVTVDSEYIGVTEVEFTVNKEVWGGWLKVKLLDDEDVPSSVNDIGKETFQYLTFTTGTTLGDDVISGATVSFKVEISWLEDLDLGKQDVALYRYVDDAWVNLDTGFVGENGDYYYYQATTPGFSYFAIAEGESLVEEVDVVEETVGDAA